MKEIYASNIISLYHIAGLKAFINEISTGSDVKGEVMLSKAHWEEPLLSKKDLAFIGGNISVVLAEPEFSLGSLCIAWVLLLFHSSSNTSCYIVSHSRVNLKLIAYLFKNGKIGWKTSFAVVVFDEGIGSYGGFFYRFEAYLRESKHGWWHRLLYLAIYPVNQIILRAHYVVDYNWQLIKHVGRDGCEENYQAIAGYCKYFKSISNTPKDGRLNKVFLITQPLVDLGLIDNESYLSGLRRLVNEVNRRGCHLYIKPHSSENSSYYESLDAKIIASNLPVESLIVEFEPALIVGLSSTALINSRLIMGVQSYSIISLFENSKGIMDLVNQDSNIKNIFKYYVREVLSWQDLGALLDTNKSLN